MKKSEKKETIVGIEPTDHYWFNLGAYLENEGILLVMVNPYAVKQTKRRIKDAGIVDGTKIIVHPEMYNIQASSCVAVLTQERLLRLFKMDPTLSFDCVVVDEAHEILEDNFYLKGKTVLKIG